MAETVEILDDEPILEPDLPIIDSHQHLYGQRPENHPLRDGVPDRRVDRYLLEDALLDTGSGHNILGTVFIECRESWRTGGPEEMRPVGETDFVAGIARQSATGEFGPTRMAAGIVGHVDFRAGDRVRGVLEAHIAAGDGRFRGIRQLASWDADPNVMGPVAHAPEGLYLDEAFRGGFGHLGALGLSFDAWCLEPQIPEVTSLAAAFPGTTIVLDHVGSPMNIASYRNRRDERFPIWKRELIDLAAEPNTVIKLGGLGFPFAKFPSFRQAPMATSEQLAAEWAPIIETCIEIFGPDRALFESNFPPDKESASYQRLWNAFKRITASYSVADKAALYSGTARRVYRLEI